jgi:hypothetical protein
MEGVAFLIFKGLHACKKISLTYITIFFILLSSNCFAYIVIAKEKTAITYGKGKVYKNTVQYEFHYDVDEENKVVYRKEVNNFRTGQETEDSTTYSIIENSIDIYSGEKMIKAVGKPALDSLELIVIGKNFVLSCRSTADYFIVTDMQRENVTKLKDE